MVLVPNLYISVTEVILLLLVLCHSIAHRMPPHTFLAFLLCSVFLKVLIATHIYYVINMVSDFFPGPQAFCKKAVERINSEKNILNR